MCVSGVTLVGGVLKGDQIVTQKLMYESRPVRCVLEMSTIE